MAKLLHSDQQLLSDWAQKVVELFNDTMCYHVGSSMLSSDVSEFRDVDIRTMLDHEDFLVLQKIVNIDYLNLAVSLWGQKVTGLPIDFQVQDRDYVNEKHKGSRSAVGLRIVHKGDGYE